MESLDGNLNELGFLSRFYSLYGNIRMYDVCIWRMASVDMFPVSYYVIYLWNIKMQFFIRIQVKVYLARYLSTPGILLSSCWLVAFDLVVICRKYW